MAEVRVIRRAGSFRLIHCPSYGYAVVESRAGGVYSTERRQRRRTDDSEAGMFNAVGRNGWRSRSSANAQFDRLVAAGRQLAENMR